MNVRNDTNKPVVKRKTLGQSVGEITGELRKVAWPTRQEVLRLTAIVLIICVVSAIILGLFDYGFAQLISKVFVRGA